MNTNQNKCLSAENPLEGIFWQKMLSLSHFLSNRAIDKIFM